MKAVITLLVVLVLTGTTWGQEAGVPAPTKAEVIATMQTSLVAEGNWGRLSTVAGFDKAARAEYVAALLPQVEALSGPARTKALITIYSSFVAFGPDTQGLGERITSSVAAIADPADKALAASYVLRYPVYVTMRTVALSLADTPGLPPDSQRVADGLGILKDRREPKNLTASWNLKIGDFPVRVRAWYGPSKVDLKRILVLLPVAEHKSYVAAVNAWLVRSRTPDLTKVSADYQTFLKDGAGGTDLLAGVTLPADDEVGKAALAELERTDLSIDNRVDMLLVLNRNREAFVAAESQLNSGKGVASANVYRVAKVIKAIDGNWKRATEYVNLFQPRPEGAPAPVDPISDVKRELGL
jgi:hypothetical protein